MNKSKKYSVYMLTDKINNKKYIGMTSQKPESRWSQGKKYIHNKELTNAIEEDGWDNFDKEVILETSDREIALKAEERLILDQKTTNPIYGFNKSIGGYPMTGVKHSDRTKQVMSEKAIGRPKSEEHRRKISESLRNRPEDMKYRFSHSQVGKEPWCKGLTGEVHPLYGRPTKTIINLQTKEEYISMAEASRATGESITAIYGNCNGRTKRPRWAYKEGNK